MAKIIWTEQAFYWLKEINDYISLNSPATAQKVVSGLYEKIQILCDFPEIGYIYRKEADGLVRILLYGHYRIAYFITIDGGVTILGIFHGAMEIDHYLR
jgi:toxin ParE1/3/4